MAKSKITILEKNLAQIKEWKKLGATDEQICNQLGVSRSTWYKHIKENPHISDAIKTGTEFFVLELRGELARQSILHTLETKKQYVKKDLETGHSTQYTEITTKQVDGNLGAIHLLLKNLDRENWKNDWDNYELKKQELELRKEMAENKF